MPIMHPDKDVEQAVGPNSLEFKEEIQAGYKNLSVICTQMEFKVIDMDEITKKGDINQKQKREVLELSPEHDYIKISGKINKGKFF